MRKIFFVALATVALASCTNDDYVGMDQTVEQQPMQILFNGGSNRTTRADATGATAAAMLNNQFRVFGTMGSEAVFDNYLVDYNGNIGSDDSNTHGWTYLGQTSLGISPATQTIKYWDLNQPRYDFVAFSGLDNGTRIVSTESNTIKVDATNMYNLYISDRVSATYSYSTTGQTPNVQYGKEPVTFTFKRMLSRVRLGIYETVPGYAVRDVRFYYDDNYLAQAGTSTKTNAGLRGTFPVEGEYIINYDENNKVVVNLGSNSTTTNNFQFGELDYTTAASTVVGGGNLNEDGTVGTTGDAKFLATSSALPTFAKKDAIIDGQNVANSDWQPLLPLPSNSQNLVLRVDFTLVSLDGVGTPIEVKGASAVVPVKYAQWQPNYAYTYIFKISDKTNGTTGTPNPNPSDPDTPNPNPEPGVDPGLYPITFDAVVSSVEEFQQETITGITNLGGDAITTYSETSDVTNNNEYKVGETVTVSSYSHGRWGVAYSSTEPTTEKIVNDNNTYAYTFLAGEADANGTINQNGTTDAQFTVEKAGYYIVWLRYLPTGLQDIDANYVDVFKIVKTVE